MSELVTLYKGSLTPAQVAHLADVPPELEWLANITNETGGTPDRHSRPRHRMAFRSRRGQAVAGQHPAQTLGGVVVV
jgi:hypothetical protein